MMIETFRNVEVYVPDQDFWENLPIFQNLLKSLVREWMTY